MRRRTLSIRSRTELMFQVATVSPMISRSASPSLAGRDRDGEVFEAVDVAVKLVSPDHRTHAIRRSRIDQVAGRQLNVAREVGDRLGHAPDQVLDVALLPDLAVDLEPDRALVDMADLRNGRDRRAGRGLVE